MSSFHGQVILEEGEEKVNKPLDKSFDGRPSFRNFSSQATSSSTIELRSAASDQARTPSGSNKSDIRRAGGTQNVSHFPETAELEQVSNWPPSSQISQTQTDKQQTSNKSDIRRAGGTQNVSHFPETAELEQVSNWPPSSQISQTQTDKQQNTRGASVGPSVRSYLLPGKRGPQYSMSQSSKMKPEPKPTTIIFDMPESDVNKDVGSEINHLTLSFIDPLVEREYASFFTSKATMKMWRIGLIIGLAVSMILFLYNGLYGDTPIIDEALLLAFTAVFPIVTLLCSSYLLVLRQKQTAKFAHIASTLGVLILGGAAISFRHYLIEQNESSYKTGLFYILLLMGAHVMLRIRFFYLAVSMPLLLSSYIIEQVASMRATSVDHVEDIFISTICLTAAMCIIASSSYATENATRKDFLISRVSKKTTTKLVEQLKRLQKTYTHQVADFDSPLEKSIILVKSILADPSLQHQHINSLSKLLGLLKSGDLMTPDIQKQVEGGLVDLDKEQEVRFYIFNIPGMVVQQLVPKSKSVKHYSIPLSTTY